MSDDTKTPTVRRTRSLSSKTSIARTPRVIQSPPESEYENVSSIKPDKFDKQRFSQFQGVNSKIGLDTSARRAILLAVVIIVLGAGLILVTQAIIRNNQNTSTQQTPSTSNQTTNQIKSSNSVLTTSVNTPGANDFGLSSLAVGSANNLNTNLKISGLDYTAYKNSSRLTIDFSGVTSGLPVVQLKTLVASNQAVVTIVGLNLPSDLVGTKSITPGNVTTFNTTNNGANADINLTMISGTKYAVSVQGSKLTVDFKQDSQLALTSSVDTTAAQTPTPAPVTAPTPTPTPTPATKNLDNAYSQLAQSIVNSEVTGNNLVSETYFYQDFGDSFSFSWAIRGVGNIPNATAKLITNEGVNYVEVKISNLSYDLLHSYSKQKATIGISTAASNLKNVFTKGFTTGVATFWVELGAKSDYKLYSTLTEGAYQLLTIQVKDN